MLKRSLSVPVWMLALLVLPSAGLPAAPPEKLTLPDFALTDHRGRQWTQADFQEAPLLLVAFMGTECPLAKLYAVRLSELDEQFGDSLTVVAVDSNKQDSLTDIANYTSTHNIEFPVLKDGGNRFADQLGAERTPEVFLFDSERQLRYWGRIDDQFGIGYARDKPQSHDLKNAIVALQTGRRVRPERTRSVGCIIGRSKPTDENATVTFANTVANILQKRCVECHREGEVAPFALTDYEQASGWADMIAETVEDGRMPPWHADPAHGEFKNSRRLTDAELQALRQWADAGAPQGDPQVKIEVPPHVAGWQLPREPDVVVPVSEQPVSIQATGEVRYQYYRVDPGFEEDVWLEAAELQPGNRRVVHHILCFARPKSGSRKLNAERGFLVGYVPGARVEGFPAGMAKKIEAGSELIFQVHYTPVGTPQTDQSRLGLVFADADSITHEIKTFSAVQGRLNIPPGAADHEVSAATDLSDALLLGMSPHMHLRGKSFRYAIEREDGTEVILDVPNYDFNWQTTYVLAEPLQTKQGERMLCTAVFDNSEDNPYNPDPTKTVRWGDQTDDEMMIGYFHYAVPRQETAEAKTDRAAKLREMVQRAAVMRVFERIDTDADGVITREQTPVKYREAFDRLNGNGDAELTRKEVETARLP
ncbi:redoxin domain-containing protein [Roseimaritima ulvae]|uniref:Thiol-disulfide oxidoreductase n=1 Tax=Roseimaritima ulvae TaxID=980254 RepID=A0A5B9QQ28_9BACT|nr:redoxin domain-containing protein [Roseimaritima ulvae]QEG41108.1 hypothetical protein UC8_31260 [Roseimaritima ulvae]